MIKQIISSIIDYQLIQIGDTPVSFNVFEDWNEESVVVQISFVSYVINY